MIKKGTRPAKNSDDGGGLLGESLPPRRMVSLAQQLAVRGAGVALGSICGWDPSSVLNKIIERQPRF